MNLNQSTFRVFGSNGILMNMVNYSEQVQKYGVPIAVSPNGLNFIFKKNDDQIEMLRVKGELADN